MKSIGQKFFHVNDVTKKSVNKGSTDKNRESRLFRNYAKFVCLIYWFILTTLF